MDKKRKISIDSDTCFLWMKNYVNLENPKVDYYDRSYKMNWFNIRANKFENNIKNSDKGV